LLSYKDFISSVFDDGLQIHSVYTNFQKAFDTVSHELLLLKMHDQFGISGSDLHCFGSHLADRRMRVIICGVESH